MTVNYHKQIADLINVEQHGDSVYNLKQALGNAITSMLHLVDERDTLIERSQQMAAPDRTIELLEEISGKLDALDRPLATYTCEEPWR